MAFVLRNLSVLAYANGFTLWHYRSAEDAPTALDKPGYFAEAGDLLASGDIVMVSGQHGARIASVTQAANGFGLAPLM
jgi:hypothetical protein